MRKEDIQALAGIALFYILLEGAGVTCPIRFLTGISCAGCGMSRAWLAVARLDLSAAFYYHPLFWLPVPGALLLLFQRRLPKRLFQWGLALVCALFLVVYFARLLSPDNTVVAFEPSQGLLFRLLLGRRLTGS